MGGLIVCYRDSISRDQCADSGEGLYWSPAADISYGKQRRANDIGNVIADAFDQRRNGKQFNSGAEYLGF